MLEIIKSNAHNGSFTLFNEAVGSKDGTADLITSNDSVLTKTIEKTKGNITLTAFSKCLQRLGGSVDLLKMDCEGCEWEIFKDGEAIKKVKYLTMEYHLCKNQMLEKFIRNLKILGFSNIKLNKGDNWGLLRAKRKFLI